MLLYSTPGVGKTIAASIAPKALIISCEGGLLCLEQISPELLEQLDLDILEPKTVKDVQDAYDMLFSGAHEYETVILDSLTELSRMSLDEIAAIRLGSNPKKTDEDSYTLQDYGKNTNRMIRLTRAFRDLDMNVVMTTTEQESKDEIDGSIRVLPNLTPKLAEEVMSYVDIVGYMMSVADAEKGTVRKMLAQPWSKYRAKDRSGKLGPGLTNPTMYQILHKINGTPIPEFVNEILKELENNGRKN